MSLGCTSGPTDHLLTRHGIRAQKSVMVENTRAELLGKCTQTSPWFVSVNHNVSGLYYTAYDVMFYRIRYNIIPGPI